MLQSKFEYNKTKNFRQCYNNNTNVWRRESYEEALKINDKYKEIWKNHKNFKEILNVSDDAENTSWNKKFDELYMNIKIIMK